MNVCARSGQVIFSRDVGAMLVLGQHKWATLVWQLVRHRDEATGQNYLYLSHSQGAFWIFIFNPSDYEAFLAEHVWSSDLGLTFKVDFAEPFLMNSLRNPKSFTHAQLLLMAKSKALGLTCNRSTCRNDLLRMLAECVSEGDAEFINSVMEADVSKEKTSKAKFEKTDLLDHVLASLPSDEQQEFSDMKKDIQNSKKVAQAKQWRMWYNEKVAEKLAPLQLSSTVFHVFHAVLRGIFDVLNIAI